MYTNPKLRLRAGIILGSWLGLAGCSRSADFSTTKAGEAAALNAVANRLYLDISYAQDITQRMPNMPSPDGPITYEYGTNADHKAYRFANLQAFRLNIKRRMDSLRVAGRVLKYDTTVTGRGPVGKMVVD